MQLLKGREILQGHYQSVPQPEFGYRTLKFEKKNLKQELVLS